MIDLKEIEERVILAAVSTQDGTYAAASLDELEDLARTAGAVCVAKVIQNRESVHPGTYLGKGKIDEVKELVWETGATGLICDDELSPAQLKNLEEALELKVMDRTMVILDIFASRAHTREGKIQVELAQLRYRAARLVGMRASLSRLGGGIGTRGPGQKSQHLVIGNGAAGAEGCSGDAGGNALLRCPQHRIVIVSAGVGHIAKRGHG